MGTVYHDLSINVFDDQNDTFILKEKSVKLEVFFEETKLRFLIFKVDSSVPLESITVSVENFECGRIGRRGLTISNAESSLLLTFPSENDLTTLLKRLKGVTITSSAVATVVPPKANIFDQRTDKWSAVQYFQFYSFLSQQQNMMQDYVRTATYQRAVLNNIVDFKDKVVLDVGAGSGILSFFAIQGGAKKVYAVEASNMAEHCEALVMSNKLAGKIVVLANKVEEIEIPEPIDLIISEPMGYMLFNERMLESFVHARKFLRPGGKMFPSIANLYIAPFSDDALYMEQYSKANFWYQQNFHGVDLSSLRDAAVKEYFRQPVVDSWDVQILLAPPCKSVIDFQSVSESEFYLIDVPLVFTALQAGMVHGYAFWFDVGFLGSQAEVWLSTAPTELLTHWYQVRCLFLTPIFVSENQQVQGRLAMRANSRQSYDVDIEIQLPGMTRRVRNTLDLKNPCFRYTGLPTQPPPGANKCPTDTFWSNILHGQQAAASSSTIGASTANASVPFQPVETAMDTSISEVLVNGNSSTNSHPCFSVHAPTSTLQPMPPISFHSSNGVSSQFMIGDYAAATATVAASRSISSRGTHSATGHGY